MSWHTAITRAHNFTGLPSKKKKKEKRSGNCTETAWREAWCGCWLWMCGWRSSCGLDRTYVSSPRGDCDGSKYGTLPSIPQCYNTPPPRHCTFSCSQNESGSVFFLFVWASLLFKPFSCPHCYRHNGGGSAWIHCWHLRFMRISHNSPQFVRPPLHSIMLLMFSFSFTTIIYLSDTSMR